MKMTRMEKNIKSKANTEKPQMLAIRAIREEQNKVSKKLPPVGIEPRTSCSTLIPSRAILEETKYPYIVMLY